jgi:hypothetical protein
MTTIYFVSFPIHQYISNSIRFIYSDHKVSLLRVRVLIDVLHSHSRSLQHGSKLFSARYKPQSLK